ncbi:ribonuclease P protein component [Methylobacterium sp. Leaf108]|uniref:ribonuclease P protein component n=1 Tax=Methylobacterium sp. Leaf108 TaxID=1736256 RepID=UPI000A446870|nr:ribonuclease P protein component [Methylobacterium sp. Leaf108]
MISVQDRRLGLDRAGACAAEVERTVSTIERLKKRSDFLSAAGGRRFHTDRMTAQGILRPNPDPAGLRIGFTVTKRVGHATERNRIKRRLRSVVEQAARDLPDVAADVVLVARRPSLHAPFGVLVDELRRAVGAVTKPRSAIQPDTGSARPSRSGSRSRGRPTGTAPSDLSAKPVDSSPLPPSPPANLCDGSTDG